MCNDYELRIRWAEYCKMMQALELRIPAHQTELDLPEADDIKINDPGPVMRLAGEEAELAHMTFGLPPASARGGSVSFPIRRPPLRQKQPLSYPGVGVL